MSAVCVLIHDEQVEAAANAASLLSNNTTYISIESVLLAGLTDRPSFGVGSIAKRRVQHAAFTSATVT